MVEKPVFSLIDFNSTNLRIKHRLSPPAIVFKLLAPLHSIGRNMQHFNIRQASPPEIREIYAHNVLNSTTSSEVSVPDIDEMLARLENIRAANRSYLVCEVENKVAGYAYCSPNRSREAYRFTIEASIYHSERFKGMGLGKGLLKALIVHSRDQGFRRMVSVVTGDADNASYAFHLRNGFTHSGALKDVGQKFGQTIDTHFIQRAL